MPFGSNLHVLPIVLAFFIGAILIYVANNKFNNSQKVRLFNILGFTVSFTVIAYHCYLMLVTEYDVSRDLPLFLCSFMALIIPILTYYRKFWMYDILVFWILAGTTQAIITPDISKPFPDIEYFRYWIVHLGLVVIIMYATFVFNYRPTYKSVFKSIMALQAYILLVFTLNWSLGSNYSYLMRKPNTASVLDYLGDWPVYVISAELIAIPYFLLICLLFNLSKRKKAII